MKILVAGAQGQVARALHASQPAPAPMRSWARTSGFDLLQPEAMARTLAELNPDLIVNAAAYTAVDNAEREAATAYAINRDGAGALAVAAAARRCPSSTYRPTMSSPAQRLVPTAGTLRPGRPASTGDPGSRARRRWRRQMPATLFCGRPGSTLPTAAISCAPCCALERSGRRCAWLPTNAVIQLTHRTSPRRY